MSSSINIVCVLKSGGKIGYDQEWVYKLKRSLQRNLSVAYNFYCLSDVDIGGINVLPLINHRCEPPFNFWYKLQLFRHPQFVNSPTIYFDLDIVLCQNIDQEIITVVNQSHFLMLWENNEMRGVPSTANSSIMFWNGDYTYLWKKFQADESMHYHNHMQKHSFGDQGFIKENVDYSLLQPLLGDQKFSWAKKKGGEHPSTKFLIFTKPSCKPNKMLRHHLVAKHWI